MKEVLLNILICIFITFLLVPLKQTEVYCILLSPSPKLFQPVIKWGGGDFFVQALSFLMANDSEYLLTVIILLRCILPEAYNPEVSKFPLSV